jgi:CubicO group peptidase (beta-lactamase class C family)
MGLKNGMLAGAALALSLVTPLWGLAPLRAQTARDAPALAVPPQYPETPAARLTQPPVRDPADLQVLFWTAAQREMRFREMERWFAGHEVPAANAPRALSQGTQLAPALRGEIKALMAETGTAGVMVLVDGKVAFEHYGLGLGPADRWTSFSVAKSFTSTLLGAAVKEGLISLDDPVTKHIPGLAGSAYEDVTVRQLATMTSGVKWNESYTDPNSDVAQTQSFVIEHGANAIVAQMKSLPRETEPGAKWVYKTGETNLIGVLVENATGMPLAEYAKAKIIDPAGFEGDLFWMVDPRGGNIGGCCLSLRLSDYARMGQFALEGGKGIVPDDWFAEATDSAVDFGDSGFGYGYQWWTYPQGTYGAQGIFGQGITLFPDKGVVFAYVGNWGTASGGPERGQFLDLSRKIAAEAK